MDQLTADDGKKKKKSGGMNAAVASTEKIRSWVSIDEFIKVCVLE
ncbi:MAG: hypothetical protein ACMG6E_10775 [Candidatus Roizmanbacteria bacterium]